MKAYCAVLVIGPTGVGKSPLGDYIEAQGFRGARCGHFDFGENLRAAAAEPDRFSALNAAELGVIRSVLDSGALLEDRQFPIVEKLFSSFTQNKGLDSTEDWVVLNGMPRHAGQAAAVSRFADVKYVLNLVCDEETVVRRIQSNAGGDRTGRVDDALPAVRNKLAIFKARTLPLLAYYRDNGDVSVMDVSVDLSTSPKDIVSLIIG